MKRILFLFALVASPSLAQTRLEFSDIEARATWKQEPMHLQDAVLRLVFRDKASKRLMNPKRPFRVEIRSFQFGRGLQNIELVPVKDARGVVEPGTFDTQGIVFLRGGPWIVRVFAENADGSEESDRFITEVTPLEYDPWLNPSDPIQTTGNRSMMCKGDRTKMAGRVTQMPIDTPEQPRMKHAPKAEAAKE